MKKIPIIFALAALASMFGVITCSDDDGGQTEICNNNVDDDGDTFTDCADPDCNGSPYCPTCPNGVCEMGETPQNCPQDCSSDCDNDGVCETGENETNCSSDCGCDNDGTCESDRGENASNCSNDCSGGDTCETEADLIAQTGCTSPEVCGIDTSGAIACVAAGTGAFYSDACDTTGCVGGSICLSDNECAPYCDQAAPACPSNGVCAVSVEITTSLTVHVCTQGEDCSLSAQDCAGGGDGCYMVTDGVGIAFICGTAGAGGVGATCTFVNNCQAGLACTQAGCKEYCEGDGDCSTAGDTCLGIGDLPAPNALVGVCGTE